MTEPEIILVLSSIFPAVSSSRLPEILALIREGLKTEEPASATVLCFLIVLFF